MLARYQLRLTEANIIAPNDTVAAINALADVALANPTKYIRI